MNMSRSSCREFRGPVVVQSSVLHREPLPFGDQKYTDSLPYKEFEQLAVVMGWVLSKMCLP